MKKPNIIVFDVDNTLIKGNLMIFFIKFLAKEKFYFLYKSIELLIKEIFIISKQLPFLIKVVFKEKNIYKFNQNIFLLIKQFYQKLFVILKKFDLLDNKLQKKAHSLFSEKFFEKYIYPKGINKIKHHLRNPNNIVILLSGSLQEVLNPFFQIICKKFTEEKITWHNRFFVIGTQIKNSNIKPCIGSEKNKLLNALLKKQGYDGYTLKFIYSDNHFLIDLPLLIESKNGAVLIANKSFLYKTLPQSLLKNFIFRPYWNKI